MDFLFFFFNFIQQSIFLVRKTVKQLQILLNREIGGFHLEISGRGYSLSLGLQ